MAQSNLQVRLDKKLREKAEKVFKKIGMDMPTAIDAGVFVSDICRHVNWDDILTAI